MLDVYIVWPESAFTSCSNIKGISNHCEVLLEVEWGENCREHQVERLVPVYHKTNFPGLQSFLRSKFPSWESNRSCVEEIWERFKEIVFESIDRFVPHKILRKIPDPEYYNKELKQLKVKVRRVYNKRKLGQRYQAELKRLSKELLAAMKNAREPFLLSVLRNEGNCWSEFYKYVKRRRGNREIVPVIKDHSGTIITDSTEKTNILNSYYAPVFCCDRNIPKIQLANSGETRINTKVIRKK